MSKQVSKILIVDDNAEDRSTLRRLLEQNDEFLCEFIEVELGETGIETCRTAQPDCVLLEYDLPDTDGLAVIKKLNPDPRNPAFPVILVTGARGESLAVQAIKNGAQDYLVKGKVSSDELCSSIRNAIEIVNLRHSRKECEDESVTHVSSSGTDITESRQIEERLRRNQEIFFNLVQNAPFGIYVVDADFRLVQISKGSQKIFKNVNPLIGRDFAEVLRAIWTEPFAGETIEIFRHTLATGETYRAADVNKQRGNAENVESYDWKIERITLPDGRFGVVCYFYDLTERLQFEEDLRESEDRFRNLADNMSQFAWMADASGSIFWYNERWYEYTGTTFEEMKGWGWSKVHQPEHLDRVVDRYQQSLDSGEPWEDTFPLLSKKGEYRWFLSRAVPIRDKAGNILRWFGTNTDIEELRLARQQAEDANRAKDEFLAVLSHELRTPLNAMYGWTQILENSDLEREKIGRAIEIIARNVRLQNALIEDLLDVSRIISGKMELESEKISLVSTVQSSIDAARPSAEKRLIKVESEFDPSADEMFGDKNRLQQVIGNLLTNAIKFTPENGKISVILERHGDTAVLTVKDSGIGISPKLLPQIFERFHQADGSSKRKYGGLGLGLTIVKHLVELHGGNIEAYSAGEDSGATFTIEFPLIGQIVSHADLKPVNKKKVVADENEQSLNGVQILLVDDDLDAIELLRFVLENKGAKVFFADSARDALVELQNNKFDLLISDLGMSGMDGFDLIHKVRQNEKDNGNIEMLPAIALTGYVSVEDRERVLLSGFQIHLPKPLDIDRLSEIAVELVGR